jgi:hypothetical protein
MGAVFHAGSQVAGQMQSKYILYRQCYIYPEVHINGIQKKVRYNAHLSDGARMRA